MEVMRMSDADLLAVLCGTSGRALAKRPLSEVFGFNRPRQDGLFAGEDQALYTVAPQSAAAIELFVRATQEKMQSIDCMGSPKAIREFLCGRMGALEHEVFWCLWLDAQNRLIAAEEVFRGTLTQTAVYPREVVKRSMATNAAAVVFAHNHPSGLLEPSRADECLTANLKQALGFVDVKVLDHFVVGGGKAISFAEKGLI